MVFFRLNPIKGGNKAMKKYLFVFLSLILTLLFIQQSYPKAKTKGAFDFNVLDFGTDKTDVTLQKAIDHAQKNGGGVVYVPAGYYSINRTVIVKPTVSLQLSTAATFNITKDINGIELKKNSNISGGMISAWGLNKYTKSAIYIDGRDKLTSGSFSANISNVKLTSRTGGNGIFLYAQKGSDHIGWVQADNVNIHGFEKGIHLKTNPVTSPDMIWVDGNNFSNILISDAVYGIYLDGHRFLPYEVAGNMFNNVQIQNTDRTKISIYIKGNLNQIQAMIWDVRPGKKAIYLDADSRENQIRSNAKVTDASVVDLGENNLILPFQK